MTNVGLTKTQYTHIVLSSSPGSFAWMEKKSLAHTVCVCVKKLHIFFIKLDEYLS